MNINSKIKIALFFLLFPTIILVDAKSQEPQQLDLMVDFAYPVSMPQSVRQDLSQALYFLQHDEINFVISSLQDAVLKMNSRQPLQPDDRDFIEEMIAKIDELIASLGGLHDDQRSIMLHLSDQLRDSL
ncbi:MAG: hypothetical protein JO129_04175 [Candidatus Dependentiae bacterium]|nr:hypothetical protein [Candidatus Dependentiae bacterium]